MTTTSGLWFPRQLVATKKLPPMIEEHYNNSIQEYIDFNFTPPNRELVSYYFLPTNTPRSEHTNTQVLTIDVTIPLMIHSIGTSRRKCCVDYSETTYFHRYCGEHLKKDNPTRTVIGILHIDRYAHPYYSSEWCSHILHLCVSPIKAWWSTTQLLQLAKRKDIYENYMNKPIRVQTGDYTITAYSNSLRMLMSDMSNHQSRALANIHARHETIITGVPPWLVCRTSEMLKKLNSNKNIPKEDTVKIEYLQHHKDVLDKESLNLATLSNEYAAMYQGSCVELRVKIFDDVCTTPLQVELAISKYMVAVYGEEIAQVLLRNMFDN